MTRVVRIAYADPPYLGLAEKFYGDKHENAGDFDKVEAHAALLEHLAHEYAGFAYSLTSTTLQAILPVAPAGIRVAAWVKPFASFKPNVNPAYAWEPILFRPARTNSRSQTVRDWCAANITLERGFVGAKPDALCYWIFDLLGAEPDDDFSDIFPGSGAVARAWDAWRRQTKLPFPSTELG